MRMTEQEINHNAMFARGIVLNAMAPLERAIDFYLARHFCETFEKEVDLILLFFGNDRISFENKRQVFQHVIDRDKHPIFIDHPKIAKQIETIMKTRNVLAHYSLDTRDEAKNLPKGVIQFRKLKNVEEAIPFSKKEAEDMHQDIVRLTDILDKYYDKIPKTTDAPDR